MSARKGDDAPIRTSYTMSLLQSLWEETPEPDYELAAQRHAGEPQKRTPPRVLLTVLITALLGFGIAAATTQLRAPVPAADRAENYLIGEIDKRSAAAARLQQSNADLAAEIQKAQESALAGKNNDLLDRAQRLEGLADETVAAGPGISITLTDGAAEPLSDALDDKNRVQDRDLQTVVNGLWAAGATAVAINGNRMTSLSSIRAAGQAILVNYTPLSPPYRVEATGDPTDLQSAFARLPAADYLQSLKSNYDIGVDIAVEKKLSLPASGTYQLKDAKPKD